MTKADYWVECIESALEEHGVSANAEQIKRIAADVQISAENQGLAFHVPEYRPFNTEVEELRKQLREEKSKVLCKTCKGSGEEIVPGFSHYSISQCWRCHGEGRHVP